MPAFPKLTPDEFFANLNEPHKTIAMDARKCILETAPELVEEMKYGLPFYTYKGMICFVNPSKTGVVIGFSDGAMLSDTFRLFMPNSLLKQVRHISLPNSEYIHKYRSEIQNYLTEAMVLHDSSK